MFDALRQLRDAVAPESGSLGTNNNTNNNNNSDDTEHALDTDELWKAYKAKDPDVLAMVPSTGIHSREDFCQWHAKQEMEKDTELVLQLASVVLEKSRAIDRQVQHNIPGMHRTRSQQNEYIAQLVQENAQVARELEETYEEARQQRDQCRAFIRENTCRALGIEEDTDAVFL